MKTIYKYLIALFAILLPLMAYAASETSNPYDKVTQGKSTATDKDYVFNIGAGANNPKLRGKASTNKLQFAHDGTTFKDIGSGGGAGGGGVVLNTNTGFEEGLTAWTASGGTFTLETTAANVGFATQAGAWNPSAASQTLSNDAITVPAGLFGKVCSLSWYYKGGDANLKAQVYDGSSVIAESAAMSTQATYSGKQVIYFTCPSSGTIQARFIASADAALVYFDDVKIGQESLFNVFPKSILYKGKHDKECTWTIAATVDVWGDPANDATCTLTQEKNSGFGTVSTTGAATPGITFTAPETGVVEVCAFGAFISNNTNDYTATQLTDASNVQLSQNYTLTSGTASNGYPMCGFLDVTKGASATAKVRVKTRNGTSTFTGFVAGNFNADAIQWSMKYVDYANTSEAISIDQSGWRIDANIGGANIDLGTSTIATYTEVTDASLDLVLAPGSAGAEIPCSSTNPSSGLTCSAGSESVGLAFTPPSAGTYEVCSAVIHNANLAATGTAQVNFQLVETPNNAQTILQEGNQRNQSGMDTTSGALNLEFPNYVCGVFNFADTSKRTIRLMREQVTGGTVNNNRVRADRSTANGQRDIHFKVRRRVEFADVVKFTNMVTTGRALGLKIAFVGFGGVAENAQCTSSPCTIHYQSGEVTSVTRTGGGLYNINWAANTWTQKPMCSAVTNSSSGSRNPQYAYATGSNTVSPINMYDPGIGFSDAGASVTCMGY